MNVKVKWVPLEGYKVSGYQLKAGKVLLNIGVGQIDGDTTWYVLYEWKKMGPFDTLEDAQVAAITWFNEEESLC